MWAQRDEVDEGASEARKDENGIPLGTMSPRRMKTNMFE